MTAEYFDEWFSEIARSDARQRLFTDALGLPEEIGPSNLVPLTGLRSIAEALELSAGDTLVDLACGRGGPGMWVAREVGARLVGIDFSAAAIEQASARRVLFELETDATFAVGSLDSTGLTTGGGDAVMCVDAFQFADDPVAVAEEIKRILRRGGRVALTSWEPVDRSDESISERIRKVDLAGSLEAAGFTNVASVEKPEWHEIARTLWQTAVELDPAGDPALASTVAEAKRSLANHDKLRRMMATATAP